MLLLVCFEYFRVCVGARLVTVCGVLSVRSARCWSCRSRVRAVMLFVARSRCCGHFLYSDFGCAESLASPVGPQLERASGGREQLRSKSLVPGGISNKKSKARRVRAVVTGCFVQVRHRLQWTCTQAFGPYFVAVGVSGAVSKQWPVVLAVDLTRAARGATGHANGVVYRWLPKAAVLRCCCLLSFRPHRLPFTFVRALQLQQPQV